jgi:Protein of unknown function (DUF2800)
MQHSSIGPSSSKRILNCPGSVELVAQAPKQPDSPYAEEGTKAHTVAECYLLGLPLPDYATDEMIEAAKEYALTIEMDMMSCKEIQIPLQTEVKLHVPEIREDAFGTCDAFFIGDDTIFIYDFKYGKGVRVDAYENEQMMYYAAGVRNRLYDGLYNYKLTIIQPRLNNISVFECDYKRIQVFVESFKEALTKDTLAVGDHCKFCPAMATCPAQISNIADKFGVCVEQPITPSDLLPPNELGDSELRHMLDNAEMLRAWISAVEKHAYSYLGKGGTIPGYELAPSYGNRKWNDPEFTKNQFIKLGYEGLMYEKKLKSPAQMEKVCSKEEIAALTIREESRKLTKSDKIIKSTFDVFTEVTE